MKKGLIFSSFVFALVLVMSFSVVSAGVFFDSFKEKINNLFEDKNTGQSVTGYVVGSINSESNNFSEDETRRTILSIPVSTNPIISTFSTSVFAQDSSCISLFSGSGSEPKFNVVVLPDGYSSSEDINNFVLDAKEYFGLTGSSGLFNIEPFKSNKNKFNIYYVNYRGSFGGVYLGGTTLWNTALINDYKAKCRADEVVLIFNEDFYHKSSESHRPFASTCNHFASVMGRTNHNSFNPIQLGHEFGHSFGCLRDIYPQSAFAETNPESYANLDKYACPKWCSGTPIVPEPNNQICPSLKSNEACNSASVFPECRWQEVGSHCESQGIAQACQKYSLNGGGNKTSCLSAYSNVPGIKCEWSLQGFCMLTGSVRDPVYNWEFGIDLFNIGQQCQEGYGCYQGAEGFYSYSAEPTRDTIMGGMVEPRYDIASQAGLVKILEKGFDYDKDTYFTMDSNLAKKDCDDYNQNINPGKTETCGNSLDDNCDGKIDEFCVPQKCTDSDGGIKPGIAGSATVNGNGFYDSCVFNRPGAVNESFCTVKGRAVTRITSCLPGNICYHDACKIGCQTQTLVLGSSTTLTKILTLSLPTERISVTLSSVLPQSNQAKLSLSPASTPSAVKVLDLSKGSINYFTLQSGRELKIELISLIETTGGDKKATVRVTSCKIPDLLPTTYNYLIAYDSNSSVDPDCWFVDKNKNCNTGDFWSISTRLPQSSYGCISGSKSRLPEPYNGWILQNYTATKKAAPVGRSCGDNTNRIINITLSKDPIHYPT